MTFGSAYSPAKAALVTRLEARSGLAGVNVLYQAPEKGEEIRGDAGYDLVFFDTAEGNVEVRVFAGESPLIFDEEFDLSCVIQVLREKKGTQQEADERAGEILFEVHSELAHQGLWDMAALGLDGFEYVDVVPAGYRTVTGFLPAGAGHGARIELNLRVRARSIFIP